MCDNFSVRIEVEGGDSMSEEERWTRLMWKMNVFDLKSNEKIGIIYLDPYNRREKMNQGAAVSYPIRFSLAEKTLDGNTNNNNEILRSSAIVIVELNSTPVMGVNGELLLYPSDIVTLFHELGHALHMVFNETKCQQLAGTRCQSDFMEFPSTFLEQFATQPEVFKSMAKHYESNEPVDAHRVEEHLHSWNNRKSTNMLYDVKIRSNLL